jgi:hypothetical protein
VVVVVRRDRSGGVLPRFDASDAGDRHVGSVKDYRRCAIANRGVEGGPAVGLRVGAACRWRDYSTHLRLVTRLGGSVERTSTACPSCCVRLRIFKMLSVSVLLPPAIILSKRCVQAVDA